MTDKDFVRQMFPDSFLYKRYEGYNDEYLTCEIRTPSQVNVPAKYYATDQNFPRQKVYFNNMAILGIGYPGMPDPEVQAWKDAKNTILTFLAGKLEA